MKRPLTRLAYRTVRLKAVIEGCGCGGASDHLPLIATIYPHFSRMEIPETRNEQLLVAQATMTAKSKIRKHSNIYLSRNTCTTPSPPPRVS
jgi:hypothetical protein